jgi:V-type H+-transporting ATPase subunit A
LHGSTSHNLNCMLGLRPRLKTRPSLLDLIQKKNIDEISASVERVVADVEAYRVPLPASPLISPQPEAPNQPPQLPLPRITLQEDSEEEDRKEEAAKMPPVSFVMDIHQCSAHS